MTALTRRTFLGLAFTLPLVGCGGGGGEGTKREPLRALDGRVQLPARLTLVGTEITCLFGSTTAATDGAFRITAPQDGFQFVQLLNSNGTPLLVGLLQEGHGNLSVRSTAETLVYLHLGLFLHTPPLRRQALDLLRGEDLTALESAIASAIADKGTSWLASPPAAVLTAAKAAASAIKNRGRHRGMIITPTDRVSGIQITGDGIATCTATNYFRRRGLLYYTPLSAKLDAGNEFSLPTKLVKVELSPTDGLSSPLGALADLFVEGKSYYTPVDIPLDTARSPADAAYTKYQVYSVGLGIQKGTWDSLPQLVRDEGKLLMIKSAVLDFVLPLLASVIIPGFGDQIDEFVNYIIGSDVLKDIVNLVAKAPDIVAALLEGNPAEAGSLLVDYIRNTDSIQVLVLGLIAAHVQIRTGGITDPRTGKTVDVLQYTIDTWKTIDESLDLGELALTAFDSGIQLLDIASSRMGETWDIAVTKAKTSLIPDEIVVKKNALFSGITAKLVGVDAVEGKVFGYTWKCDKGKLSTGDKYGSFIDSTTKDSVGYDAVGLTGGTKDTIAVQAFLKGGGTTEPIGSATAKVYVIDLTVSPASQEVKPGASVTLTPNLIGMRPLKPGERITYKWLTTRNAGQLNGSPDGGTAIPVEAPTATYKADDNGFGQDQVRVEAFLGTTSLGEATATLDVNEVNLTGHWTIVGYFFDLDYALTDNNGQISGTLTIRGYETAPVTGTRTGNKAVVSYPLTVVQQNTVTVQLTVIDRDHLAGIGSNSEHGGAEHVTWTRTSNTRSLPSPARRAKPNTGILAGFGPVEWEDR